MTTTVFPQVPVRDVLTESEAIARAQRISDVSYELSIDLTAGSATYRGECTLAFAVADTSSPLFIDFKGGSIDTFEVNGRPVAVNGQESGRLVVDAVDLAPRTSVRVVYENPYDTTGDGFHRFVDPEDDAEYVYSNFQPFAAHRLFPCFDQPDLKATYRLTVDAPATWEVISNDPVESVEPLGSDRRRHRFPRSKPFSTYLLPLICGPFHSVHRERPDGVTMGLYCRRSLARYMADDVDELFQVTGQGLDFFTELFDQPYPFVKYDQLFVPEFNVGAMENVGAVTFTESVIFRDPPTETQRQDRAEVMLHEIVHMWFGNLVTMRWWNDLWLNESFATYIAYLAQVEATRFTGAWKSFTTAIKRWAYRQDQLPTTHPIRGVVADTDVAFLDFDGITYGKGASVLKQLVATIGADSFREGVRAYFRRYAWGNATLADFLAALEEGSGRSLGSWARVWLETASLNTISARWEGDDGTLSSITLEQTATAEHPVLRPHTLLVALVSDGSDGQRVEALPATIDGPSAEVRGAAGRRRPWLVFPNHDDHAYAKVALDSTSLEAVADRLAEITDPLLRELLWMSLWEMVRDAELTSAEFLRIVRRQVPLEPDPEVVEEIMRRTQAALRWYVPEASRQAESSAIVELALAALPETRNDDTRIVWSRAAIAAAASARDLQPLLALADGTTSIAGVSIDQQMRWDLATKSVAFDLPDAADRLAAEVARDGSDRGQRARIRANVARPDAATKAEAWERIHEQGYGSFHLTRAAMEGFHWPHQGAILQPYADRFFERVRDVFATRDQSYATAYLAYLFPDAVPDAVVLERGRGMLEELTTDEVLLRRSLLERLDDDARALRVRAFAEASPSP